MFQYLFQAVPVEAQKKLLPAQPIHQFCFFRDVSKIGPVARGQLVDFQGAEVIKIELALT